MLRIYSVAKAKYYDNKVIYCLAIWIGEVQIFKVGTTSRTALSRLKEIGTELMTQLGYWPRMKIMMEHKHIETNYAVEAAILAETKTCLVSEGICPDFSGRSELRAIEYDRLVEIYARCLNGKYETVRVSEKVEL